MTEQAISPLRRRMIEDMTIRKFAQKTQLSLSSIRSASHMHFTQRRGLAPFEH